MKLSTYLDVLNYKISTYRDAGVSSIKWAVLIFFKFRSSQSIDPLHTDSELASMSLFRYNSFAHYPLTWLALIGNNYYHFNHNIFVLCKLYNFHEPIRS